LDQVCRQLEEILDAERQMHFTAANLAWARHAEMLLTYVLVWQSLDQQGRSALFDEQRAWEAEARRSSAVAGAESAVACSRA
jgi:hypothetical protein